jgi:hypothetical protein
MATSTQYIMCLLALHGVVNVAGNDISHIICSVLDTKQPHLSGKPGASVTPSRSLHARCSKPMVLIAYRQGGQGGLVVPGTSQAHCMAVATLRCKLSAPLWSCLSDRSEYCWGADGTTDNSPSIHALDHALHGVVNVAGNDISHIICSVLDTPSSHICQEACQLGGIHHAQVLSCKMLQPHGADCLEVNLEARGTIGSGCSRHLTRSLHACCNLDM